MAQNRPDFHSLRRSTKGSGSSHASKDRTPASVSPELAGAELALVLLTIAAPHFLAGIFAWATAIFAGWALLVLLWLVWATRNNRPTEPEPMLWLMAIMVMVTALQALPMPAWATASLMPKAVEHATDTAQGLRWPAPRWISFSLDPGGTWERVLYGIAVLAAFGAARLVSVAFRSSVLLIAVAASGLLVALSDLGHRMLDAKSVYGMYVPSYAAARGPLLNANNLAGLLALAFPICLGLAVWRRGSARWPWLVAGATIGATGLLASSRAGTIVLLGGPILFGLAYWRRQRRDQREERSETGPSRSYGSNLEVIGLVLLASATGVGFAALAADDFLDTAYQDVSKLEMLAEQAQALLQEPRFMLAGAGRGAFRVAFSPYLDKPLRALHAECLPLQYAMEFGIPIALVLLVGAMWRVGRSFWRWQSPAQLGGLVGVAAIGTHNLIDFSLELSGIAVPAAVCLGAALPRARSRSQKGPPRIGLWHLTLGCGCACAALGMLFVGPAIRADILRAERHLQALFDARDRDAFWQLFNKVVRSHPAEPSLAALAAADDVLAHDDGAAFWLNRVMTLAPGWAAPHLWAAQWLSSLGHWEQAEDELRAAGELDTAQLLRDLCAWVRARPTAAAVLRLAPIDDIKRMDTLDEAAQCLTNDGHGAEAARVDEEILRRQPRHFRAALRRARRSLWSSQYQSAAAQARALRSDFPREVGPLSVEAEALQGLGSPEKAAQLLTSALDQIDDRPALLEETARAQARAQQPEAMRNTIEQLRLAVAGDGKKLPRALALLADCELILHNDARALKAMLEAHRLSDHPKYLVGAAQIATRLGQLDFALRAWSELCEASPNDAEYCHNRDKLRSEQP